MTRARRKKIQTQNQLEGAKRDNEGLLQLNKTWLIIILMWTTYIIGIALIILTVSFIIPVAIEYYQYLVSNKEKLLIPLFEKLFSHSISFIFGATPFFILWQKK